METIMEGIFKKGATGKKIGIALIGTPTDNKLAKTVLFGPDYLSNPEKFEDRIISFKDIQYKKLVGVKVLDKRAESPSIKELIQGMRWTVNHKDHYKIDTISMTLPKENMFSDKQLIQAIESANKAGLTIIIKPNT